jgi:hypothetical protein
MASLFRAMLCACCLAGGMAASRAQDPPVLSEPPPSQPTRVYDFVAAMVGNRAILASQVTTLWRDWLRDDEARPRALRKYVTPAKRHALWGYLLETLVRRETEAQSARLMGRAPDEVEAHVQRLVEDDLARKAETAGGLNAFARHLGSIGQSMGSVAEDARADYLRAMVYYQGVLRELHDQKAMLATPKEMKALFEAEPRRFDKVGSVRVAVVRFPRDRDAAAAQAQAEATIGAWRALSRPVTEAAMRALGTHVNVIEVNLGDEAAPALRAFTPSCQPGDVSPPLVDEGWVWVLLCLSRVETQRAQFQDAAVQEKLRKEIADRQLERIFARLFPENRVGVRRLPWGEPATMDRGAGPVPPAGTGPR